MNIIKSIEDNIWLLNLIKSLIVIVIGVITYKCVIHFLVKKLDSKEMKIFSNQKSKTYLRMIKNLSKYIFVIIVFLIILSIYGINISSMLAGIGVLSIIIGFAIQDALKDIIKGIDIISDNYYQVGDVIKYADVTGKVLSVGIKTTKLEDIYTMNIVSISNRNIEKVEIISTMTNIDIPLPYELKIEKAEEVINDILERINELKDVEKTEYRGVNELSESCIKYQIKVYSQPIKKVQTRRNALTLIIKTLEEKNISVPYNQIDIHKK